MDASPFPHRTFREYLAAVHLISAGTGSESPGQPAWRGYAAEAAVLVQRPADIDHWRVVLQLAAGLAAGRFTNVLGSTVLHISGLLPKGIRAKPKPASALLAAELLAEIGKSGVCQQPDGKALWERVEKWLLHRMTDASVPAPERAAAGVALGHMGDPRDGVAQVRTVPAAGSGVGVILPVFAWSHIIPSGPFPMGNDEPEAVYDGEQPRFSCTRITEDFRLALYPVTVAQFQTFIDAGGYTPAGLEHWWTAEGRHWAERKGITGPMNDAEVFQTPNHPRVGISWYEAVAFCRWHNAHVPPGEGCIGLPTEAQWERVARNGAECRRYPWEVPGTSTEPDQHANMDMTGIGHTSAVGLFPAGAAPCGALDLSGNVWEWCRTAWQDNYANYNTTARDSEDLPESPARVLRGGSWNDDSGFMRASFRNWDVPRSRLTSIGFRVVWLPPF